MGLYDLVVASVGGMAAQSNALTNIGQNVANLATVGYKRTTTNFASMVNQPQWRQLETGATTFSPLNSGGVTTNSVTRVLSQGTLTTTSSATDLAVNGLGMFVVSDSSGNAYLTRSGSFVADANGNLVNSNGYYLMSYGASGSQSGSTITGLEKVNVGAAQSGTVAISSNGALSYQNAAGATVTPYHIPLVTTPSMENLAQSTGNVFSLTEAAGTPTVALPGTGNLGAITSGSLEQSTADAATELSNMIVAQYDFRANSEAMKAGTDMMSTLVNLKVT